MRQIISKNLKLFREAAGYCQHEIAFEIGVRRSTYAKYEAGYQNIPQEVLQKLSELYAINYSSFFEEDPKRIEENMACAFKIEDSLDEQDLKNVSAFRNTVRNYLKLSELYETNHPN